MERSTLITIQLTHWNAAMQAHTFCPMTDAVMTTFITFNLPLNLSTLYDTALPLGSRAHIEALLFSAAIAQAWHAEYGFAPTDCDVTTLHELIEFLYNRQCIK
ncbi:hypothetical protein B9T12_05130 [Wohlfahrtiimonas chitiniclastica]|uniref:hypothetical protein n=1 Tax=Wohlfahrtiimonas chitiniclastica TaxID=400946 RepID=UPI000B99CD2D|nr:hypothetical protein [Wohlfahrtiimonas chitiniclastica]OYQ78235.1 hypothetical protein B9T12_05130 [Wohlfahrtiimonas chitiniclastica]